MSQATTNERIETGYKLLNKLLAMQTDIDSLERAPVEKFGPSGDELSKAVREIALILQQAQQAIPLMDQLAAHGRELETQGKLEVECSDSYADATLAHLLQNAAAHTSNAALPTYSALLALAQRLAFPDAGELLILEDYRNIARNVVQPDGMKIEAAKV